MIRVRAVCFDLDNTLWDVWPVIRARRAGDVRFSGAALSARGRGAHRRGDARRARKNRGRPIRRCATTSPSCASRRCGSMPASSATPRPWSRKRSKRSSRRATRSCCTTTCCPAWSSCAPRFRLFTASNGNADLARIGLAHYFERSVAARQVGALKPDPADLPQGDRRHGPGAGTRSSMSATIRSSTWWGRGVPACRRSGSIGSRRRGRRSFAPPDHSVRSLAELASGLTALRAAGDCIAGSRRLQALPFLPAFNHLRPIALPLRLAYIPRRSLCLCPLFSLAWPAGSLKTPPFGQLLKNPTRPRTLGLGPQP